MHFGPAIRKFRVRNVSVMSHVKRQSGRTGRKKSAAPVRSFFFLGGAFMSSVVLFFCLLILPAVLDLQSNPVRVDGLVLSSSVRTGRGTKGGTIYRPDISFSYSYENQMYVSHRVGLLNYGSGESRRAYDLVKRFPKGSSADVLVNPARPGKGFLDTGESFWETFWIPILFLSVFFLTGLAVTGMGIVGVIRAKRRTDAPGMADAPMHFAEQLPAGGAKPFPRRRFNGELIAPAVAIAPITLFGVLLFAVGREEFVRTRGLTPLAIFAVVTVFFFIIMIVAIVRLVVRELGSRHFSVSGRAAFSDRGGLAELTYASEADGAVASEITVRLIARRQIGRQEVRNKRIYRDENVVDKILTRHSNSPVAAPRTLSIEAPDPDLTPEGHPLEDNPSIVSIGPVRWFLVIDATFPDSKIKTSDEFRLD